MTQTPKRKDVLSNAMRGVLIETHTALVAEVKDWDKETRTITAQPVLQRKTAGGELKTLSPIPRVPVIYPGGGDWEFYWPMSPGDEVLLIVSERSIDRWLKSGGITDPKDSRIHDLNDSFCIPRTWNLSAVSPAEDGKLVIQKTDGSVRIELSEGGKATIKADEVKLGDETATDTVALSSLVAGELAGIKTALDTIAAAVPTTHSYVPGDVAATKVKAK